MPRNEILQFRKASGCSDSACPAGAITDKALLTTDIGPDGQPTSPIRTVTSSELRFATAPIRATDPAAVAKRVLPAGEFSPTQLNTFGKGILAGEFNLPKKSPRRTAPARTR